MFRQSPLFFFGLLAATVAWADTPMVAHPLAPSALSKAGAAATFKPADKLRLPPPTVTVTRLVRQADGSLRMQCEQEPNPRAKIALPAGSAGKLVAAPVCRPTSAQATELAHSAAARVAKRRIIAAPARSVS